MRFGPLLCLLAIAGCAPGAAYIQSETDTFPVRLTITNAGPDYALRCLLSMAHFITQDIAPIAAGNHVDIKLRRSVKSSTLYYQETSTPQMAVENIFCGLDHAWAETKTNLNMAALRSDGETSHNIICTSVNEMVCTVEKID